jgi:hypothetical protein
LYDYFRLVLLILFSSFWSWVLRLKLVISASWEVEIRRIMVEGQPR